MYVNLFFDGISNGELLTFKTWPPCMYYCLIIVYGIRDYSVCIWSMSYYSDYS